MLLQNFSAWPPDSWRKLRAGRIIQGANEKHASDENEDSVEKKQPYLLSSKSEESNVPKQIPVPKRDPNREVSQVQHRMIEDLRSGMQSKRKMPGTELTNGRRNSSRLKDTVVMSTKQTSLEVTSGQRRRILRPTWRYTSKKDVHRGLWRFVIHDGIMFFVPKREEYDSTVKQHFGGPPMSLWSETRKQGSTSSSLALKSESIWSKILSHCYRW